MTDIAKLLELCDEALHEPFIGPCAKKAVDEFKQHLHSESTTGLASIALEHLATALCEQYSSVDCSWPNYSCKTHGDKRDIYETHARLIIAHLQRLSAAPLPGGWRPISEYAGHGKVLAYSFEHGGQFTAFIDATGEWWMFPAREPLGFTPTHFKRLGPSPVADGETRG